MSDPKSQLAAIVASVALLLFASVGFACMLSAPASSAALTSTTPSR